MYNNQKTVTRMLIIIFVCGILDYILTYLGQNVFGVIVEINPVMIPIVSDLGLFVGTLLRVGIFSLLCLGIYYTNLNRPHRYTTRMVTGIATFEMLIIAYHTTWFQFVI